MFDNQSACFLSLPLILFTFGLQSLEINSEKKSAILFGKYEFPISLLGSDSYHYISNLLTLREVNVQKPFILETSTKA